MGPTLCGPCYDGVSGPPAARLGPGADDRRDRNTAALGAGLTCRSRRSPRVASTGDRSGRAGSGRPARARRRARRPAVGRRGRRRRPQRAHRRGLPGPGRPAPCSCWSGATASAAPARSRRPFADERFVMSPCAYLVGLLAPLVIEELDLRATRLPHVPRSTRSVDAVRRRHVADRVAATRTARSPRSRRSSPADVDGYLAYERAVRPDPRARCAAARGRHLDRRRARPRRARGAVRRRPRGSSTSCSTTLDRRRRRASRHATSGCATALHGQGVIGTFAGPRDPGTAWVHAHHRLGTRSAAGATSRAGWGGSRSASPTRRSTPAPCSPPGSRSRRSSRARGCGWRAASCSGPAAVVSNADPDAGTLEPVVRSGGVSTPTSAARVGRLALREPGGQGQLRAGPAPDVRGRARPAGPRVPGPGRDRPQHRRHPGRVRSGARAASRRPSGASSTSRRPTTRRSRRRRPTR